MIDRYGPQDGSLCALGVLYAMQRERRLTRWQRLVRWAKR